MGKCCGISISETGRSRLAISLSVLNFICIVTGLGLLVFGLYVKYKIQDHLVLIEAEYNADIVPYFFISVGCFLLVLNITGGKILLDCSNPRLRDGVRKCLLPFEIVGVIVSLAVLVGMCLCFASIQQLEDGFEAGIQKAMLSYKQGGEIKEEVDQMQMDYRCCGGDSYADWFRTSWVAQEYVDTSDANIQAKMTSGNFFSDDVPFSCCDPLALRPCVHHHVQESSMHYKYTYPQDITLFEKGCTAAMMDYFADIILMNVAFFSLGVFGMQFLLILLTRLLQTSIDAAYELGDKEAETVGYIFMCGAEQTDETEEVKEPLLRGEVPSKISMNDPKCNSLQSLRSGQQVVQAWNSRQSVAKAAAENIYDDPAELGPVPPPPPPPPPVPPFRPQVGGGSSAGAGSQQSISSGYIRPISSQAGSPANVARKQSSKRSARGSMMSNTYAGGSPYATSSRKDSVAWE